MADQDRYVQCGTHGKVQPAFVCTHLVDAMRREPPEFVGWFEAEIDPNNREWGDMNGWCRACEDVAEREGGWNDRSEGFAKITLVCEFCFATFRDVQSRLAEDSTK